MINNLQSKRLVSRQEYEDNYDRIFRKPEPIDVIFTIQQIHAYKDLHPELDIPELCELYKLDYKVYQSYTNKEDE